MSAPVTITKLSCMFIVTEADAAAISAVYDRDGELSAAVELRRRFPGFTDNAKAREWVRAIAGWRPLPVAPKRTARRATGKSLGDASAAATIEYRDLAERADPSAPR